MDDERIEELLQQAAERMNQNNNPVRWDGERWLEGVWHPDGRYMEWRPTKWRTVIAYIFRDNEVEKRARTDPRFAL